MAGAFAALLVMLSASAGVAYASDDAIPGDSLYPLDCALEDLGLGDGGMAERLSEAGLLVGNGHLDSGLELVAEALSHQGGRHAADTIANAANALRAAADHVMADGSPRSAGLRARVAERLLDLAASHLSDDQLGQAVVSFALGLGAQGPGGPEKIGGPGHSRGNGDPGAGKDKTTTTTKVKPK